jgi:succinate dehydrogenase / fumarate reductase cytochrome b subunit
VALQKSLVSPESHAELKAFIDQPLVKLALLGLVWACLHHTFAGIRHLALDLRVGIQLAGARASAFAVLIASFGLTIVIGALLW